MCFRRRVCGGDLKQPVQTNFVACLQFLEASHIVEILREAGPKGLHVNDITRKVAEIHTSQERVDLDPSKFSEYCGSLDASPP